MYLRAGLVWAELPPRRERLCSTLVSERSHLCGWDWWLQVSFQIRDASFVNRFKSPDLYCCSRRPLCFPMPLRPSSSPHNLLPAASVREDSQVSTVRRTLITALTTFAPSTASAWTSRTTTPAAAGPDSRGRCVNWKQMSVTASHVKTVPPV